MIPAAAGRLPLADIRVIAVEQYGAGPWATLQLADLGADVVKIEDPRSGGDVGRYIPPFQEGEDSLFFETFNRNKTSIELDLRTEAGRGVLHDLIRESDALYCNLRGDHPAALGLTYDDLRHVNPRIVCCSLSGFGRTGPRASEGAYDYILQGLAGWMSVTGNPDGPPTKSGLSLVDYAGGYVSAFALMAGLWQASRDGVGCDCDISLFETALALLTYLSTWTASAGFEPVRMADSAHPSIVPFQSFATADGEIVVACAKEKFWQRLCVAIGREDLAADARFADFKARHDNREALMVELYARFAQRGSVEWLRILKEHGVPSGPVNTVAEALLDRQVEAREGVVSYDHPRFDRVRQVASPVRVGAGPFPVRRAPFRGEHTVSILRSSLGYSAQAIEQLRQDGAFGVPEEEANRGTRSAEALDG